MCMDEAILTGIRSRRAWPNVTHRRRKIGP
jgi:hypothetical protein